MPTILHDEDSTAASMPVAQSMASYLTSVTFADLPPPAKRKLKLCLVANLSAAQPGARYTRLPRPPAFPNGARLLASTTCSSPQAAAAWNAAVMHARMQDDMSPSCNIHAGTVVIPAALAAADIEELRGNKIHGHAFLSAIAAGYASASGIARRLNPVTTPLGFRSTSLYGCFGATTAAARVLGLGAEAHANALCLTTSQAAGLNQCWHDGSDEWQVQIAWTAETGLRMAELSHAGIVAAAHAFEGRAGFVRAHGYLDAPTWGDWKSDFDAATAINETLVKRYPMSGIVQPVACLTEMIAVDDPLDVSKVIAVHIHMNAFEASYPGTASTGPFGSFSSVLMSAVFAFASVASRGRFEFSDLVGPGAPGRDKLLQVTRVVADDTIERQSSRIVILFEDGSQKEHAWRPTAETASLGVDEALIDEWSAKLWAEAGRTCAEYQQFRAVIDRLECSALAELWHSLGAR